ALSRPTANESLAPAAPSALYTGRVLDPQGKPFAGASLHAAFSFHDEKARPPFTAKTNAAGRFQVGLPAMPKTEEPVYSEPQYLVMAQAPGHGLGIATFQAAGKPETLQLTEDVPLNGRIIDLQGRPLAGVTVRPERIWSPRDNDLTARLQGCVDPKVNRMSQIPADSGMLAGMIPPAVTGADGRFHIKGIGRERILTAVVEGPTIETAEVSIMTRRTDTVRRKPKTYEPGNIPKSGIHFDVPEILGADSDFVAAPTRLVTGLVRDGRTGHPLVGVEVEMRERVNTPRLKAVTDHDGRYRLVGLPVGREVSLSATVPDDQPYFDGHRSFTIPPGEAAVDVSFSLKRGIWIRGRAIDRSTGRPVAGVVSYHPFADNPYATKGDASEDLVQARKRSGETNRDGDYRVLGLPGHGLMTLKAALFWEYAVGVGAGDVRGPKNQFFIETICMLSKNSYHYFSETSLPGHVKGFTQNLTADPGRSVTVKMTDPEGKPLTGVVAIEDVSIPNAERMQPSESSEYKVHALAPGENRTMTLWHNRRRLIARITVHADQSGPMIATLEPWGVVTGRLVDTRGELGGSVRIDGMTCPDFQGNVVTSVSGNAARFPVTEDGRFRVEGLVPGTKYNLQAFEKDRTKTVSINNLSVASGEIRDLGDLTSKDALR
ncbi:carboxypeptidase regulatory-like domain-containing protein, partial [Singulisphaera rosea]